MDQLRPAHKLVTHDYLVEGTNQKIARARVPTDLVQWKVPFPTYAPKYYIKQSTLDKEARSRDAAYDDEPSFRRRKSSFTAARRSVRAEKKFELPVDPEDLSKVPATDAIADRPSYEGSISFDSEGFPLNPRGRTGLRGRGSLWMWGPNHAADPIITRKNPRTKKLQMLALKRGDEWRIPGSVIRQRGDIVGYKVRDLFQQYLPKTGSHVDLEGLRALFGQDQVTPAAYESARPRPAACRVHTSPTVDMLWLTRVLNRTIVAVHGVWS